VAKEPHPSRNRATPSSLTQQLLIRARSFSITPTESADNGVADLPAEKTPEGAADALAEFTPPEPPPAVGIPDPETELAAYKSVAQVEAVTRRPARITALQVRKPNDQEYVRVMPGGGRVLPLFRSKADGDKLYLFRPEAEPFLPPKAVRKYRVVLARSLRAVTPFVWALPVPQDDMGATWHESADAAARDAEARWVKVVADMAGGCYVTYPAAGDLPEPEWPSEPLAELILIAFKNQRIDAPDYPVIRRLKGELV
jgi:hypothetical protein